MQPQDTGRRQIGSGAPCLHPPETICGARLQALSPSAVRTRPWCATSGAQGWSVTEPRVQRVQQRL